ncbi:hypothetical protein BvCmsNSNP020_02748 [Escherichia coli]|nr:hypothetical protein BvCmsNSNP020_02748 [Escherichia coli]
MVAVLLVPLLMPDSSTFQVVVVLPAPLLMPDSKMFPVVAVLLTPLFKAGFRKLVRGEVQVVPL